MVLCAVNELLPGMVIGAAVPDPRMAGRQLIAPRVLISEDIISGLKARDVHQVWVHYSGTEDLDIAAGGDLSFMQTAMLANLRDRFSRTAMYTVSSAGAQEVRGMVMELITEHASKSSNTFVNAVISDLAAHRGKAEQSDDITILTVRVG